MGFGMGTGLVQEDLRLLANEIHQKEPPLHNDASRIMDEFEDEHKVEESNRDHHHAGLEAEHFLPDIQLHHDEMVAATGGLVDIENPLSAKSEKKFNASLSVG